MTPSLPMTPAASAGRPPLSLAGAETVAPGATSAAVVTPQALITLEAAKLAAASSAVCNHVQVGNYVLLKRHETVCGTGSKTGKVVEGLFYLHSFTDFTRRVANLQDFVGDIFKRPTADLCVYKGTS